MELMPHPTLPDMIAFGLVAPRIKVLYVPTTKVACSTLKLLISQAEGSYNAQAAQEIITPNISQEQTIRNPRDRCRQSGRQFLCQISGRL